MYKKIMIFIFIYTVFGFKLSLLGRTGDEQSGNILSSIRIDDVIIVFFVLIYILKGKTGSIFLSKKPILCFLLYTFVSLVSTVYNSSFGEVDFVASLLFTLRPLEYYVYIALGYELAKSKFSPDLTLKFYVIYCFALIAGQTLGIIGGVSNFSFDRAIANTGGPWELAAVAAFLMSYFIMSKNATFTAFSSFMLILTQSRITLVASILVFLFGNLNSVIKIIRKKIVVLSICIFTSLLSIWALYSFTASDYISHQKASNSGVTARFETFGSNDTLTTLNEILVTTKAASNRQDYFNKTYGEGLNDILTNSGEGDASAFVRFTRWVTLVKTTSNNIITLLIGLGPSYAGKAVDGNYVRIFVETGLVGLITYLLFLLSCLKNIKQKLLTNYVWILMVTALFIDIFVTFKAMFFFWFFYGYYIYNHQKINTKEA
ncbi:hypothetical protein WHZ68_05955 [Klebsiella oxytoca]|uniref:hypothetical protein n=1 Tax=Klebsiella oxytoca TaxID=571 RepID=UPI00024FFF44|nr:hypothetical protein [Klebsiella oxytoca]EHS96157.1 hypothetical protein HMPREF9687_02481 [Klebsiella oxytoca 10-5243]EHT9909545.1 hypothetical protein [Klebsiella oxytoca]ELD4402174.1 hypothetical protein [Klebsiella oxytoca]EUC86017.1 O-antigen ligase-like membrane protein [Klebsiella oxytoca KA-2]HBM3125676.1 hypothetical protein [Klebsiella oxytoca]